MQPTTYLVNADFFLSYKFHNDVIFFPEIKKKKKSPNTVNDVRKASAAVLL